jgi:hypothetical protein
MGISSLDFKVVDEPLIMQSELAVYRYCTKKASDSLGREVLSNILTEFFYTYGTGYINKYVLK